MNFQSETIYEKGIYTLFTSKTNPIQLPIGDPFFVPDIYKDQIEKYGNDENITDINMRESTQMYDQKVKEEENKHDLQKITDRRGQLSIDRISGKFSMNDNSNIIIIDVPPSSYRTPPDFHNPKTQESNSKFFPIEKEKEDKDYLIFMPKNLKLGFNTNKNIHVSNESDLVMDQDNFHLFSFLNGTKKGDFHKNRKKFPIPYFIDPELFQKKPNLSKDSVLYGLAINDKNGLVLLDPEIIKKFRGLVGEIIKQVLKAIFGSPISLPVRIFEPKSTLNRICEYWSFAPEFLTKAAIEKDPVLRMKYVISFAISGLYVPTKQLKPFNPLLGETFQGELEDGSKIYAEHICHHPTVSTFYLKGKDDLYYLSAYFDFVTATENFGSILKIFQKGPVTIGFNKDQEKIHYCMPTIKLLNSNSEKDRASVWVDEMIFVDVKNCLKAIVSFGKDSKYIHGFQGKIFKNQYPQNYKFNSAQINTEKGAVSKSSKTSPIYEIKGSWLKEILFDGNELWNINKSVPSFIKPEYFVLPSDGRYREDLIWLFRAWQTDDEEIKKKYEQLSQTWKLLIEVVQRNDREERKKKRPKK